MSRYHIQCTFITITFRAAKIHYPLAIGRLMGTGVKYIFRSSIHVLKV